MSNLKVKKYSYPCIRCGKARINSRSWKEKVTNVMGTSTSVITYTDTVCPDQKCQEIVEREFEDTKRKKEEHLRNKENARIVLRNMNKNKH